MKTLVLVLVLAAAIAGYVIWRKKQVAPVTPAEAFATPPPPPPAPPPVKPTQSPTSALVNAFHAQQAIVNNKIIADTTTRAVPSPPKVGNAVNSYVTHVVAGHAVQVKRK